MQTSFFSILLSSITFKNTLQTTKSNERFEKFLFLEEQIRRAGDC